MTSQGLVAQSWVPQVFWLLRQIAEGSNAKDISPHHSEHCLGRWGKQGTSCPDRKVKCASPMLAWWPPSPSVRPAGAREASKAKPRLPHPLSLSVGSVSTTSIGFPGLLGWGQAGKDCLSLWPVRKSFLWGPWGTFAMNISKVFLELNLWGNQRGKKNLCVCVCYALPFLFFPILTWGYFFHRLF